MEGTGPLGFQPNVADSQPGDSEYSPAWAVQHVTWANESVARELTSEEEILEAQKTGDLTIEETGVVVNCPFIHLSFGWQDGYGAIAVSKSLMGEVAEYIRGQREHHRVRTFQEEFRAFLDKHEIQYDERYLWG